jgi:hypothetical protein
MTASPKTISPSTEIQPVSVLEPNDFAVSENFEDRVRNRAYQLYEDRGREDGRAEEDWHQAQAELSPVMKTE